MKSKKAKRKPQCKPKFRVGQVVYWGNGMNGYYQVRAIEPLHCEGAGQNYSLGEASETTQNFSDRPTHCCVSEEVLRPLTVYERRS